MFANILLAIGLVLIVEGLVYALAPSLVEDLLEALKNLSLEMRRTFGFLVLVLGVCFLLAARAMGVG
ncbi:MAG: DUF2065 domain-containing protein [Planktotalea sp.]|jgi:uncharacterized protein YjeT (DUF2065 family)|uniref:DUF2065 domain-containing protein n=1 Tax=Planktotalea sp. TaxID=2029877 RepID=UPI000183957D|nr:DUF2065 domain-containing protein [Planktotalea sp.]EDZ41799.1 conserved hypothetical protein [Rhodobacteraceae bacterium HTCC2083]MBT5821083.1 DUF2065 domain-containing protein [Paracoccaceae bacterium]MDG1076019.1 DUF2065 domain-containing protein [Planktotalea sp.]MDG1084416.1 DUF2065 domain-containing protein [Planktotalea sp.]HCW83113.1 DUF2065 domain-containing protein [Paracoccaceae bacterium]